MIFLPYFRPEIIGFLRDLSPNDEEVDSSKKHTQFKTRVHKPYPISDQNGQNWYPRPKRPKNHTLWRNTYLYTLNKGVPPSPPDESLSVNQIKVVIIIDNIHHKINTQDQ